MSPPFIVVSIITTIAIVVLAWKSAIVWLAAMALSYVGFAVVMNWRATKSGSPSAESKSLSVINNQKTPEEIITDIIKAKGQAKRQDFLEVLKMSKTSLGRVLDEMEKQGVIVQKGENKGSYYILKSLGNI